MENITNFDAAAAKLLHLLYESFPKPISLDCIALSGSSESDLSDSGVPPEAAQMLIYTANWLCEEGFIRARGLHQYGLSNAVLSTKGLEVLNAKIKAIDPEKPIGEKLGDALKAGGKSMISNIIQSLISRAIELQIPSA